MDGSICFDKSAVRTMVKLRDETSIKIVDEIARLISEIF
jgi:hypothetical protein